MSVSVGPFITCFLAVIVLTVYTYVIIYVRKGLLYQNMKFAFMVISLILVRMLLPVNFPFMVSIYSHGWFADIVAWLFHYIGDTQIRIVNVLVWIWITVAIVRLVCLFYRQVKYRHLLKLFLVKDLEQYPEIKKALEECDAPACIRVSLIPDDVVPGISGILHPILQLPKKEYTSHELYYICKHEVEHYKNHDLWLQLFLKLVVCVQWFNYLAYRLEKEMTLAFEVANDQIVLADCSEAERIEYAQYVSAASNGVKKHKNGYGLSFVGFCRPEAKTRLEYILAKKDERVVKRKNIWLHYMFIVIMFLVSFFVVPEAYYTGTRDSEGAFSVSGNDLYIVKSGAEYQLYVDGEYMYTLSELHEEFSDLPIIEEDKYEK